MDVAHQVVTGHIEIGFPVVRQVLLQFVRDSIANGAARGRSVAG
jgi:hypothetical protein